MIDKALLQLMGNNKRYIVFTVLLMILGMIANITITASICYAVKLAIDGSDLVNYILPLCVAVGAVLVRLVSTILSGNLKDSLGRKVKKELRHNVYNKIVKLGVKSTDGVSMAGLTQMSLEGIEQLDMYYSMYLPQFFYSMIAPILLFAICVFLDWRVAVVLLSCVPLIPVSIVAVSKYAKKIFAKYWGLYMSMGDGFWDSVQGLKELKIFNADGSQHKRMNYKAEQFRKITMKVLVMQLASITIMDLVAFAGASAGIAFAIADMATGNLQPFVALFLVLTAVEFFLPLRALGSAFHIAMNGASAGKKILLLLQTPEPKWGDKQATSNQITLANVTFSYDGQRTVLDNVSMVFKDKGFCAIVGQSGCGKSTVANIIMGALSPQQGSIRLGNDDLCNISQSSYYSQLAVVSYNTYIFNDSVKNNFLLANDKATDSQMYEALRQVNLYDVIMEKGGLNYVISEDANNLSGGQKQRLALAVNLVADKSIYLLDEATSNIDVDSETIIMNAVRKMSNTKSIIVISHRLENVVDADNIYYMDNGKVAEQGTHSQLMDNKGGYFELYTTQKQLENGYKGEWL